ncbi:MAG: ABC transporter permease subunit [Candidatus Hydrogenedentes bacterium]|nr:ABC transporter permease subunit [Candidatus Hydrogenedentota bacterium]
MNNTWAVCKREFKAYFLTPIGYVIVGMVTIIAGMSFSISFITHAAITQDPTAYAYTAVPDFEETFLSPYLVFCGTLIMFLTPLITMRLLAEERNRGTIEFLLTQPLRDREIIFGKYLAALGMLGTMLLVVVVNLCIMGYFVSVEPPVLIFGLLTVFLMGAACISLGLFVSSITKTQIMSGTVTFGVTLILFIVGNLGEDMPTENPSPEGLPDALSGTVGFFYAIVRGLIVELPIDAHAREMALGIVQPVDIAYYVLFSAFFIFLTFRALESRNWRG